MKTKWQVMVTTAKMVVVSAEDYEDALEKAEAKVNKRNNAWCAETAWEIK